MFKELLNLSKQTVIYGFGQVASRGIAILLIPLYTAYLSPEDYGVLQITRIYNSLILAIILVGMNTSMFRVYYKTENRTERYIILNSTFIAYFLISLFIFVPIMYLLTSFSENLINISNSTNLLWLVFISAFLEGIFSLQLAVLRAEEKSKIYSIVIFIKVIIYIGLTILFVAYYKKNYIGVIHSGIICLIIADISMIPLTLSHFKLQISIPHIKEIVKIGFPLSISLIAAWVLNLSDRYMIQYLMPESIAMGQVGIYSLGDKLAQLIRFLLVVPFMLTWGAQMYKYSEKAEAKSIYKRVLNIYFFIACLLGFFVTMFSRELIMLMAKNSDYYPAYIVVPFLTFSKIFTGIILIISVGAVLTNRSSYIAISSFIAAIINVLFNFALIPRFGIVGAAFGSLFAYCINGILLYSFSQRAYYVPYDKWKILSFGIMILSISVFINHFHFSFGHKIIIFIIILLISPMFKLITYKNIFDFIHFMRIHISRRQIQ